MGNFQTTELLDLTASSSSSQTGSSWSSSSHQHQPQPAASLQAELHGEGPYKLDLFRVEELPPEVLSRVFSFLDMDSLKAARLVSR